MKALRTLPCLLALLALVGCTSKTVWEELGEPAREPMPEIETAEEEPPASPDIVELNFGSTDDAIGFFFQELRAQNLQRAMGAWALDSAADRFDTAAFTDHHQAFLLPEGQLLPSEYPFYGELNRQLLLGGHLDQVHALLTSLLLPAGTGEALAGALPLEQAPLSAAEYVDAMDPAVLERLELVELRSPALLDQAASVSARGRIAAAYGAEEMTEQAALLRLGDDLYAAGFQLLRYGGHWRILSLHATLLEQDTSGAAIPLESHGAFLELLGEEAEGIVVGMILDDSTGEQYTAALESLYAVADREGFSFSHVSAMGDGAAQVRLVRELVNAGVDTLVLIPLEHPELADALDEAEGAGVQVLLIGSGHTGLPAATTFASADDAAFLAHLGAAASE